MLINNRMVNNERNGSKRNLGGNVQYSASAPAPKPLDDQRFYLSQGPRMQDTLYHRSVTQFSKSYPPYTTSYRIVNQGKYQFNSWLFFGCGQLDHIRRDCPSAKGTFGSPSYYFFHPIYKVDYFWYEERLQSSECFIYSTGFTGFLECGYKYFTNFLSWCLCATWPQIYSILCNLLYGYVFWLLPKNTS